MNNQEIVLELLKTIAEKLTVLVEADAGGNVKKLQERKELFDTRILDMGFGTRTINCLRAEDINTIGDLVKFSENDLRKIPNLGTRSINEIREALKERHIRLAAYSGERARFEEEI